MGQLEKDVMQDIQKCLGKWESCKVIAWWSRLNSGKIRVGAHFIQMCKPGTPDYIALLRDRKGQGIALFIEAKSDTGQLRTEQKEFAIKHHNGRDIFVLTIRDVKDLNRFINDIGIDHVEDIKWPS